MRLRQLWLCLLVGLLAILVGYVKSGSARININMEALKKTVAFIYAADSSGQSANLAQPLGTGFFVQVPIANSKSSYQMLVTARHIVDPQWAQCPVTNPSRIFLRLNTKNYDPTRDATGTGFVAVDLSQDRKSTWFHDTLDNNVDVAVVGVDTREMEAFDWGAINLSEFATDEELQDRYPSDPVMSVGLLPAYPGIKRNYPVAKLGYVSNKPDELVASQCVPNGVNRLLRIWLLSINWTEPLT